MDRSFLMAACVVAGLGCLTSSASAGTVAFSGTRVNVDAPGPAAARCGSRTTVNVRTGPNSTSTGTSNLGAFVPLLSHCILLPPPGSFDLGEFSFAFSAADTLFGTYAGALTFNAPGVFNVTQDHLITGGTGKFLGASGSFASAGTLSFLNGPPRVEQAFQGMINAPGIPEPASWALMILGFGIAGAGLRRQQAARTFA